MQDNDPGNDYWFTAKLYGWGWGLPTCWQGWVVLHAYVLCMVAVPELAEILRRVKGNNRKNNWVFDTKRGTRLQPCNVQKRFREICDGLGFERRFTVHSLRKYWASTVAQQGMPWQVMIKMFGHGDFKLILETYYAQNDDARLVEEASKIDFGLDDSKDRRSVTSNRDLQLSKVPQLRAPNKT